MDSNCFWSATSKCVGSSSVHPIYHRNVELVEKRLYAYLDDSTLLAAVRKPVDRPAVVASLNRDLARIQEWHNHWCMILNPNETEAFYVSRTRTVNPPHVDLILSWCFHSL